MTLSRIILTLAILILSFISIREIWTRDVNLWRWTQNKIGNYIPTNEREPLLRISYQNYDSETFIVLENIGDAPADYFTADIRTGEPFSFGRINADFQLNHSGQGGTMTTISGRNILPGNRGSVQLIFDKGKASVSPPIVKSDSKFTFIDMKLSWGPEVKTRK